VQAVVAANTIRRALNYYADESKAESPFGAWLFVLVVYGAAALVLLYAGFDFSGFSRLAAGYPGTTLAIACLFLLLLLVALAPLSAAMGLSGLFCLALYLGPAPSLSAFGSEVAGFLMNGQVAVLPLFLLMGSFAAVAGLAEDLYALASASFGRLPAGLAM